MNEDSERVESVGPEAVGKGDVIADPAASRWLTVHEVQVMADTHAGSYRFFGDGPDDRVTFEENERVKRRKA